MDANTESLGAKLETPLMMMSDRSISFSRDHASHTSIWPSTSPVRKWSYTADSVPNMNHVYGPNERIPQEWWKRKLFYSDLIAMSGSDWSITINPVLNVSGGSELGEEQRLLWQNLRGVRVNGYITDEFRFETSLYENQVVLPTYLDEYVDDRRVMFGQGIAKPFREGWDNRWASGNIQYTPNEHFSFSLGQGKFFYGEGYRSLLLSDNALNYPYFRIETTFGPFKYINLWTQMYDVRGSVNLNPGNRRKWISTHYLSWNVTDKWNLSFYEAVVFRSDTLNGGLDVSYFNPVIFYRPIEDQVDSRLGNALLGMNTSYKLGKGHRVYGQFILDEFNLDALTNGGGSWLNKFGWQLGYGYDANITDEDRLSWIAEWNQVRPFTYTHRDVLTNYGHYYQPIAHPLGTDFQEFILRGNWYHNRWTTTVHLSLANRGLPEVINGSYSGEGSDMWVSYNSRLGNEGFDIADDPSTQIINMRGRVAYTFNPKWQMDLFLELGYRSGASYPFVFDPSVGLMETNSLWISGGLQTTIFRTYTDI